VLATLIVWVVLRLVRRSRLSTMTRTQLVVAALALSAIVLWIIFMLPAYWD
jgi:hypothetical protein